MPTYSVINDTACLRGAFKSIMLDCSWPDDKKGGILQIVEDKTHGDITEIVPRDVESIVKVCFPRCTIIKVNKITDLLAMHFDIDNIKSFGILFCNGDPQGNCQHAVRFISKLPIGIELIDSTSHSNIPLYVGSEELETCSPLGFVLVIISE